MARERKPSTCLHALRKNKKEVAALFREMMRSQIAIWDRDREIEKMVGEIDGVGDLLEQVCAGVDDPNSVDDIKTDEIIGWLEGCLCTPDEPAPEE